MIHTLSSESVRAEYTMSSLEMSSSQLATRILSENSKVPSDKIRLCLLKFQQKVKGLG